MADTGHKMPDKKEKMPVTGFKRLMIVVLLSLVVSVVVVSTAWAIPEPRRIDTSNILKPTDIEAIGSEKDKEGEHKAEKKEHAEEEPGAEEEHGQEEEHAAEDDHGAAEEHGEEAAEGEHGGGEHHPVWMIPGWQTIFSLLAVGYFALAVTYLPKIMAKEEH